MAAMLKDGLDRQGLMIRQDAGVSSAVYVRSLAGFAPKWKDVRDEVRPGQVAVVLAVFDDNYDPTLMDAFRHNDSLPVDQVLGQYRKGLHYF